MSKQGKAIAIANKVIELSIIVLKSKTATINSPEWLREAHVLGVIGQADYTIRHMKSTPHQYFNAEGKIDKRKVRRHERKQGLKPHMIRIVRGDK